MYIIAMAVFIYVIILYSNINSFMNNLIKGLIFTLMLVGLLLLIWRLTAMLKLFELRSTDRHQDQSKNRKQVYRVNTLEKMKRIQIVSKYKCT